VTISHSEPVSWNKVVRSIRSYLKLTDCILTGRRICPGIQTAEQDAYIALSRLLWAFEFTAPPGVDVPKNKLRSFIGEDVRAAPDFPLVITPRSETRVQTIEREMVLARETFSQYGLYK
jgi:hypothetical protein